MAADKPGGFISARHSLRITGSPPSLLGAGKPHTGNGRKRQPSGQEAEDLCLQVGRCTAARPQSQYPQRASPRELGHRCVGGTSGKLDCCRQIEYLFSFCTLSLHLNNLFRMTGFHTFSSRCFSVCYENVLLGN